MLDNPFGSHRLQQADACVFEVLGGSLKALRRSDPAK